MKEKYNKTAAERFWSKRLKSTDPLSAVLSYNGHPELNRTYDIWERSILTKAAGRSLKGKRVLDIACGTGRVALHLARKGANVTALDLSQAMLDHVTAQAKKSRLASRITCIHSSSDTIPADLGKFDIITCCGLMEHLPESIRRKTLKGAFRRLKKRGKMLAVINNSENIFLKGSYRLKEQKRNGYYVALVGLKWIEGECRRNNMKMRVVASNPLYAIAHYYLYPQHQKLVIDNHNLRRFCEMALKHDSNAAMNNPASDRLASHFLVEIRHQRK